MSEAKGKHTPRCPKCGTGTLELLSNGIRVAVRCLPSAEFGAITESHGFEIHSPADFAQFFPLEQLVAALRACQLQLLQSNNTSEYAQEANDLANAALRAAGEDVE